MSQLNARHPLDPLEAARTLATSRTGAPWSCLSGAPVTCVASRRSRGSSIAKLQRCAVTEPTVTWRAPRAAPARSKSELKRTPRHRCVE
jgi:hypothetical protein